MLKIHKEMIIEIIKQNYEDVLHKYQEPENVVLTLQIIYYEIGFIICAALGIVFILLMPVLGLCFCMCRCCDNCGGELHQRQKKNTDCRRSCFATTLFIVTIIITAGTLCMFAANQNLTNKIKGVKKLVNNNFQDLHALLDYTPTQLNYISQKYGIAKDKAFSDINNIGSILGGKVNARFEKDVIPALEGSFKMARAIEETKEALEKLSTSRQTLAKATTKLQANLTDVRTSLNNTLNDVACTAPNAVAYCDGIRDSLDSLNINANFSQLQGVDSELANVNDVLKTDFEDSIQKGHSAFHEIPAMLQNETKSFSSDAKIELNKIGEKISDLTKEQTIDDVINTSTAYLNLAQQYFLQYFPYLEKYDFYSKCHKNEGLYSAFQLQHLLKDRVNLSEHGTYLTDIFANINVNLSNIVILDEEAKEGLRNFTNTGIDQINFTAYIIELKKSVTKVNLHTFANDLEAKANALNVLNESIGKLQSTAANLKLKVGRVINAVESAQNLINNNSSDIVKQEMQKYSETLSGYIIDYLEWSIDSMNNAVAVCKPIANAVDAADVILCSFIVDSLNGFWFGLGCCTVFLIPSIIIAVKLAKFYRRMDTEDVYDDTPSNDTLTRFPRASAPPKLPGW
ncbi:hypothetical protein scyTo_0002990 [Scyliorhinus torazame]|uniref:Prominin-1 n=1 Tax=Scyliorhinus torazame TaxID=75743 RepID=A0A401PLD2_SCYTO|nr:hypothetical protein [Scyliorhinus torazame]